MNIKYSNSDVHKKCVGTNRNNIYPSLMGTSFTKAENHYGNTLADTVVGQLTGEARDQHNQGIMCMKLKDVGNTM